MEKEQIIKALECCLSWGGCYDCPLSFEGDLTRDCKIDMLKDALALIKELTEENKRLTSEVSVKKKLLKRCSDLVETIQAATVRKMQEGVKTRLAETYGHLPHTNCFINAVDQVAKEILNKTEDDLK